MLCVRVLRRLVVEVGLDPHLERTDALSQRSCLFDQCAPMSPPTEPLVNLEFVEEDAGVAVDAKENVGVAKPASSPSTSATQT